MSFTLFSTVQTPAGDVLILTKTRFYFFFKLPRTSVMPWQLGQLRGQGLQFHWTTTDPKQLEGLHNFVRQTLRELTLPEMRIIAETGKQLLRAGLPFVPQSLSVPDSLKKLSGYLKRVV